MSLNEKLAFELYDMYYFMMRRKGDKIPKSTELFIEEKYGIKATAWREVAMRAKTLLIDDHLKYR